MLKKRLCKCSVTQTNITVINCIITYMSVFLIRYYHNILKRRCLSRRTRRDWPTRGVRPALSALGVNKHTLGMRTTLNNGRLSFLPRLIFYIYMILALTRNRYNSCSYI